MSGQAGRAAAGGVQPVRRDHQAVPGAAGRYDRGKAAGQVLRGDFTGRRALVAAPRAELRKALSRVLVDSSSGRPLPDADLERLRQLALENRDG
ncbi:MAG: hypothetical protein J2P23_11215 [Microlunatus sp.]|nr:hypothetical protein [Microlunatus sp.]